MDDATRSEWRKEYKDSTKTPDIEVLMKFLNEQAQPIAPEATPTKKPSKPDFLASKRPGKSVSYSYVTHPFSSPYRCVVCKEKHPFYMCSHFKAMPKEKMTTIVKDHNLCYNCLHPGHSAKQWH